MTRCAAMAMVCRPEEQKRFTVTPAVVTGQPARSAIWRAMLAPVAPSGGGAAHEHVLDFGRVDPGALDGVPDHVAAHGGAMGHVEAPRQDLASRCGRWIRSLASVMMIS